MRDFPENPVKSTRTSARSAGPSSRLNGPAGSAVLPVGSDGSSGMGMPFGCSATAGRNPPSVPNWYSPGPGFCGSASPGALADSS